MYVCLYGLVFIFFLFKLYECMDLYILVYYEKYLFEMKVVNSFWILNVNLYL